MRTPPLAALLLAHAALAQPAIEFLVPPPGADSLSIRTLSEDGSVLALITTAGATQSGSIRTPNGSFDLGVLSSGFNSWSEITSLSANGATALGSTSPFGVPQYFTWTASRGRLPLGRPEGYTSFAPSALTRDGSALFGTATTAAGLSRPVRWPIDGGPAAPLPLVPGAVSTYWTAELRDGSLLGTAAFPPGVPGAITRLRDGTIETVLQYDGATPFIGLAITPDLDAIGGFFRTGNNIWSHTPAIWREGRGLETLPIPDGADGAHVTQLPTGGTEAIIVALDHQPPTSAVAFSFRYYTPARGYRPLGEFFRARGFSDPAVEFYSVTLSGDGRVATGIARVGNGPWLSYIATLPPRCRADLDDGAGEGAADGGVTIDDMLYFLTSYSAGSPAADLDDGSGNGRPDGGVTIDDLVYFLARFEEGC